MGQDIIPDYRPLELMLDTKFTKSEFTDFIGIWENFMPAPLCDEIVAYCTEIFEHGASFNGHPDEMHVISSENSYGGPLRRKDEAFLLNYHNLILGRHVNQILKSCLQHYMSEYFSLQHSSVTSWDIKVQKTKPGGGYNLWHHEDGDIRHADRELVWMIYLNDMPDGEAETEFLYQRRRIKPTKGTVVVWPAGFTHTHKGNTVLTEDKYILTGWYIKNQ